MTTIEFKKTFLPLSDRLFRFALRFTGNSVEAEDAVQEVLMKLWNMRGKMKEIKNKEAMAMTITRNHCLDNLRKKHTVNGREDIQEKEIFSGESPEITLHRKEMVKVVYRIIQELPENQRTVMHLSDIEGYAHAEIEEMTGININNVRVLLSRARKAVREQLTKQFDHGREKTTRTIEEIL